MSVLRGSGRAESRTEGKEILFLLVPHKVMEQPYRPNERERRLRPLRETVSWQKGQEVLLTRLLYRGKVR